MTHRYLKGMEVHEVSDAKLNEQHTCQNGGKASEQFSCYAKAISLMCSRALDCKGNRTTTHE